MNHLLQKRFFLFSLAVAIVSLFVTVSVSIAAQPTGPSTDPGTNVPAPINVGTLGGGGQTINTDLDVKGQLCIAGDCRSSWNTGGSWVENGSNIYRQNGNVGIGTSTPSYPLQVFRDNAEIAVGSPAAGGLSEVVGRLRAARDAFQSRFVLDTISGTGISLATNGNERLVINNSGQVGIGTNAPITNLDIRANTPSPALHIDSTAVNGAQGIMSAEANNLILGARNNSSINFRIAGTNRMLIYSNDALTSVSIPNLAAKSYGLHVGGRVGATHFCAYNNLSSCKDPLNWLDVVTVTSSVSTPFFGGTTALALCPSGYKLTGCSGYFSGFGSPSAEYGGAQYSILVGCISHALAAGSGTLYAYAYCAR